MNWVLLGVIAYIAVQFLIGVWASRKVHNENDYINAGRQLGYVIGAFTIFATWFGSEAIFGTASQAYDLGLAGTQADPFGYSLALILAGVIVVRPLYRRNLTTFADFYRQRYSHLVEKLSVLVLLPGSVFWAAAQIRSFGQMVSHIANIEVYVAIILATALVVAYTVLGGLLADAYTDFVQGLAVILWLVVLFGLAVSRLGGLSESLAAIPPERLVPMAVTDFGSLADFLEKMAVPICGTLVAVEFISRILGCRNANVAMAATFTGGALYLLVGLIPVYLGLTGPALIPDLVESEKIVPQIAELLMPNVLYVLFAGAVISAILSTVDSVLLASAGQVSHNVLVKLMPRATDWQKVSLARLLVATLAVIAAVIGYRAENVTELVEIASAAGSSGPFVVLLFGMYTRIGGSWSAAVTMIAGTVSWLVAHHFEATHPYLFSLCVGFVAYLGIALLLREHFTAPPADPGESRNGEIAYPSR